MRITLYFPLFVSLILLTSLSRNASAQTLPAGFSQVTVGTVYYPTSMAMAPDGRIFVTEKAGKVRIVKNGVVLGTNFLNLSVDQLNERGLSSIVLDPDFETNHYVYVYYTTAGAPIHNRLARYTANGDLALAGSAVTIMDFEPCSGSIHNGGGMAFGPDGKLYLAIGNDNVNSYSQDMNTYKGKVLRINKDGSVPSGNPFTGSEPAKRIWALGLRNPWSLDIQPGTGKIFVNEVGEGTWEEINNATIGGKNFGWPGSEGNTSNPTYTSPLYTYHHGSGTDQGCAITGGAFFNPTSSNYPSMYTGKYFFIDYCNNWINYLDLSSGVTKYNFATGLAGALNYIKVGSDGNLYYFSISQNKLYKIIYSNTNAPDITTQPLSQTVSEGSNVSFSVTATGASPLSFQWKKNGTNISGATNATYSITNVDSTHAGQYTCVASNAYGNDASDQATLTVTSFNAAPTATINTPASGTIYRGGDVISFSGNGTDPEDGTLPASAHNWYIEFHHDAHFHPGPYLPPGIKTGSFSVPASGEKSANVFYRLFLVVEDSQEKKDTSYVDITPKTSTLTLATQPTGLQLILDGQPHTAPYSVLAVSGMTRSLSLTSPQTLGSNTYVFSHWMHGGAATQNITVTDLNNTYTAVFSLSTDSGSCAATGTITRDHWSGYTGTTVSGVPVNTTPTSTGALTIFEGPSNIADYYGSRIRGYICPPVTGNYYFWIASDNGSELWLSTNSSPSSKVKIASCPSWSFLREWNKYPEQKSAAKYLVAGTKYYIEAIHREGTQGDHLSVGWQLPNGSQERPIPGSRLAPFSTTSGGTTPTVSITSPANGSQFSTPSNITINATASSTGGTITKVEFYNGSTKIGEDLTSPYSYTWMNVTSGNYALTARATNNTGQIGISSINNITVLSCQTPVITPQGPTTMCSGSVVLKTTYVSGQAYQWQKDGLNISGATGTSYTASTSGDYQVKTIQGSCMAWSAPTKVKIESGLRASITPGGPTSFCPGGNVKLYANTCSGYTYQWRKNGANITGATAATYTATTAGSYQIRVTLAGANAWSALTEVQILSCLGEEGDSTNSMKAEEPNKEYTEAETETGIMPDSAVTTKFELKVYPNPTSGFFTIMLNMPLHGTENIRLRVVNLLGQEIYNKEFAPRDEYLREVVELDQSLPTGVYTLQMLIGDKMESTSVVLAR